MIIANLIFAGVPVNGYAGVSSVDKLRTRSEVMTDGGESLKGVLLIENYKKAINELAPKQILAVDKVVYERESELLINLVNKLTPQNINKDYLLKIIFAAIGIINSAAEGYSKKYFIDPPAVTHSPEALLIDLSERVTKETFGLINTLKLQLTQREISYIEDKINYLREADSSAKLSISFKSFNEGQKKLALADGGQITTIIDGRPETPEFIRADKAAYFATGLGPAFWDFIRSVRIKGQVPAQKKNEKLYLDIKAYSDPKVTIVKVELKFGDSRFSYTVPGEENDKTESLEWILDDINNKINPILTEGISLTEEEDFIAGVFRVVKEKIEAKKYPRNINARAEAALRELLVYVKNNGLLDTRALIVNSSFFAQGGAVKALNTIINGGLLDDGLKLGLYGNGAEGLKKELLEDNNNIVTAGTQQDLIQKLAEKKVNPANIVVVEGEGTSIDILANSLKKLLNTEGVNKAFKEFLRKKSYVLSEKIYEKTSSPSLKTKKFEDLLALLKDANLALVFGANAISENAEAIPLLKYKIKQLSKNVKIAVWADNEAALERLNAGVEDAADIITSKGLNNALEEVIKLNKNIKNENIVLINSPEDLENIKKGFGFKEISQFEDLIAGQIVNDKTAIRLIKLQTPNVKEKKRNDMFWVIARSVASGTGLREGAVIDNYRALSKEVAEEFPKEDLNSREAIKRLDEFSSSIVEIPLVAASGEVAQLQEEYEKLQREIKETVGDI